MNIYSEPTREAENIFYDISINEKKIKEAYQYITDTINYILSKQDFTPLLPLITYIEEGDGYLAYQYIGKTKRLLHILHLTVMEQKCQKNLFVNDCINIDSLMDKYMTVSFALRRLAFRISENSVNEAISYLQSDLISYLAIHTLIMGEHISTDEEFCELILCAYWTLWTDEDKKTFINLLNIN